MISIPGCSRITDIKFLDEQTGFLVGIFNSLFKTNDGGDTWNSFNLGEYNNLNDIHLADPTHGVAVGENGTILRFVGDFSPGGIKFRNYFLKPPLAKLIRKLFLAER